MKTIAVTIAAVVLAGCSSFKLGAACYVPHGVTGQCTATTVEPGLAPVAVPVAATAGSKV